MKNDKLLIISGPTATGKTALAVEVAKKFNGELINADSRQIYRGLDIGVGKDHPKDIPIHLIDIINPDQTFSSAEYHDLAINKINELHSKKILPIIVGGTGFYIESLLNPKPTFHVKPNNILRFFLNRLSVFHLQKLYSFLDKNSYQKLNNSDINNPHRLIRKIEIKLFNKINPLPPLLKGGLRGDWNVLHLSLTAKNEILYDRINTRVNSRLKLGHLDELKNLLKKYSWSDPGLKVSCYQVFKVGARLPAVVGLARAQELAVARNKWMFAEHRDARHQKTWFKKYANAVFFDITTPSYPNNAIKLISKWYNNY